MQRVLILEPNEGLRTQLLHAVRSAGYNAESASKQSEALSLASANAFDAAVVAVGCADDLASIEKLAWSSRPIPVLATGARPSVEIAVEAMKIGARDFLGKPFSVSALETALGAIMVSAQAGSLCSTHDASAALCGSGGKDRVRAFASRRGRPYGGSSRRCGTGGY